MYLNKVNSQHIYKLNKLNPVNSYKNGIEEQTGNETKMLENTRGRHFCFKEPYNETSFP